MESIRSRNNLLTPTIIYFYIIINPKHIKMKRFFPIMVFTVLTGSLIGQQSYSTLAEKMGAGNPGGRETTLITCPENTIYSHSNTYQTGFTSWTGSPYTVIDQVESDPVSSVAQIVFYGIIEGSGPDRNFEIKLYSDNAGLPGAVFDSYTSFITAVNTGDVLYDYQIYSYTFTFPTPVSIQSGDWISIRADGGNYWYWMSGTGGDGCVYQDGNTYRCDYGDVAFCLVGAAATPVSPWAIALGIALIAIATVLRIKRSV
jgi:hypothetical protein